MTQATAEVASPPAVVRASARKNLPPDIIKKSFRTCAVHGYLSNPDSSEKSQQHGYDVHIARMHKKTSKKRAKNKVVKNSSTKIGALQIITEDGLKTVRARTKPPKAFFDLKESWVREAANCSGAEQDAFLACATDLGRLLKSFK